jgi:hypothetical protein
VIDAKDGSHTGRRLRAALDSFAGMAHLFGGELRRPADMLTAPFGGGDAGIDALDNERALELGERPHQVENELAAGCGRVDALRHRSEARASCAELVNDLNQVRQRAPQAVELPDDKDVPGSYAGDWVTTVC